MTARAPRRSVASLAIALTAAGLAGCPRTQTAALTERGGPPSPILFSHAKHVDQQVECAACHGEIAKADTLDGDFAPTKKRCAECHEVLDKAQCKRCHRDVQRPGKLRRRPSTPRLVFSHRAHGPRTKEQRCMQCHEAVYRAQTLDGLPRPRMRSDCFECHDHLEDYRALRCKGCHESLAEHPIKFVSAFNHEGDFAREHGRWARAGADVCASCHRQSYCAECHSQRALLRPSIKNAQAAQRGFIHRGDWLARHALASRADPGSCARCHSTTSCADCHRARGISVTSAARGGSAGSRSPHGAGWLSPGSPNSHGLEARRHITRCAACHDQGPRSNCIPCHKTRERGGLGVKPHPPGWEREGKRSNGVCSFCH